MHKPHSKVDPSVLLKVLLAAMVPVSADKPARLTDVQFEAVLQDLLELAAKVNEWSDGVRLLALGACAKLVATKKRGETLTKLWMELAYRVVAFKEKTTRSAKECDRTDEQLMACLMSGCIEELGLGATNSTSTENLVIATRLLLSCLLCTRSNGIFKYIPASLSTILQGVLGKHSKKEPVLQASAESLKELWSYLGIQFDIELKQLFAKLKRQRLQKTREEVVKVPDFFKGFLKPVKKSHVTEDSNCIKSLQSILDKTFEALYLLSAPLSPGRQGFNLLTSLSPKSLSHYSKLFGNLYQLWIRYDQGHPLTSSLLPDLQFLTFSLSGLEEAPHDLPQPPTLPSHLATIISSLSSPPLSSSELKTNLSVCRAGSKYLTTRTKRELFTWDTALKVFGLTLPQTVLTGSVQVFGSGGVGESLSWADLQDAIYADLLQDDTKQLLELRVNNTAKILLKDFYLQFLFDEQHITSACDSLLVPFAVGDGELFTQLAVSHIEDFISFIVAVHKSEQQVSVSELGTRPSQVDQPLLELCSVLFVLQSVCGSGQHADAVLLQAAEATLKNLVCWGVKNYLEASGLLYSSRGKTLHSLVTNLGILALTRVAQVRIAHFPDICTHTWANALVLSLLSIEEIDGTTASTLTISLCSVVSYLLSAGLVEVRNLEGFLVSHQTELIESAKFQLLNSPGSRAAGYSLSLLAYLAKFGSQIPSPRLPRTLLPLLSSTVDNLPVKPAAGVHHSILVLFCRLLDIIKSCNNVALKKEEEEIASNPTLSKIPLANHVRRIALRVIPWLNRPAAGDRQSLLLECIGKISMSLKGLPQMIESQDEALSAHEPAHCSIPSAAEPLLVELWNVISMHLLGIARGIVTSDDTRAKALLDLINASTQTRTNWAKGKLCVAFEETPEGEEVLGKAALALKSKLVGKLQGPKVERTLLLPSLELLRDIGRSHPTLLRMEDRATAIAPLLCLNLFFYKPTDPVWVPQVKEACCSAELIQSMFPEPLSQELQPLISLLNHRLKCLNSTCRYVTKLKDISKFE